MCPQAGPGTCSYLAGDGIFVFLQVGDGFSNPHVDSADHSVHIVGPVNAISHPDQGVWEQGRTAPSALPKPGQRAAHAGPLAGLLLGRHLSIFTLRTCFPYSM